MAGDLIDLLRIAGRWGLGAVGNFSLHLAFNLRLHRVVLHRTPGFICR